MKGGGASGVGIAWSLLTSPGNICKWGAGCGSEVAGGANVKEALGLILSTEEGREEGKEQREEGGLWSLSLVKNGGAGPRKKQKEKLRQRCVGMELQPQGWV